MRRRLAALLILELSACGRCGQRTPTVVDAAVVDAATDATVATTTSFQFQPLAYASTQARLHVLADGAIVFTHGPVIDALHDDGHRERLGHVPDAPVGVVGGTRDDLFYATIYDRYPEGTDSLSWHLRDGKRQRVLPAKDDFYLKIARWDGDRLLGLRANGAVRWEFNSLPWTTEEFVVVRGAPAKAPVIPKGLFIEDFVAFPSGTVIAIATKYKDENAMGFGREGAIALHWKAALGEAERPAVVPDMQHAAQRLAARAEDDVWMGGSREGDTSWFAHWDGHAWTIEYAEFSEPIRSMAIASDGALWVVTDGMLATPNQNRLYRRDGRSKAWEETPLPPLHAKVPAPRLRYTRGSLEVATSTTIDADELQPDTVAPRSAGGVWVAARFREMAMPDVVLLRQGELSRLGGAEPAPFVDLDVEDARAYDDQSKPARSARCGHLFVSAGEPTPAAISRVRAAAQPGDLPIVIARLDGKRVLGSILDGDSHEGADELATTWRKLALPATIRCAMPPLEELVVAPPERTP